jgi:putative lipoprotein
MALRRSAVFEATLEDVSRADAAAITIAQTRLETAGNPPIKFTITYDPAKILADHRYVVRARILVGDKACSPAIPRLRSSPAGIQRGSR